MITSDTLAATSLAHELIDLEERYGAHNYHPLDVVLARGEGCWVWDVDGNRYLDCLAAYSALNQGHCHPRIVSAMVEAGPAADPHQPRLSQRSAGPLLPRGERAHGLPPRAAHEHGRRGGGDGHQGRPQVGLHGEGRARRPGRDHRCQRTTSPAAPSPSSPSPTSRSTATASGPSRPASRSCPTATPWRSRRRSRPTRWPCSWSPSRARGASSSRPRARCADVREICTRHDVLMHRRRDPDRPRPHRPHCSPSSTRASGPTA